MAKSATEKKVAKLEGARKKAKLGTGAKFENLTKEIAIKSKGKAQNPGAIAAAIGRKKYGASKMAKMAVAGKKKG